MIFKRKLETPVPKVDYLPRPEALELMMTNSPTQASALDLLFLTKYGSLLIQCPACGFMSHYSREIAEKRGVRNSFACTTSFCINLINPLKGTIFYVKSGAQRPLIRWFTALNMLYKDPTISAIEIGRATETSIANGYNLKKSLLSILPDF